MKIFFDGGCRPNPGTMEVAVVARGRLHHRPDVGHGTSTLAEWKALLFAMEIGSDLGERELVLVGDSTCVIHQANGAWKCRGSDLAECLTEFRSRGSHFTKVRVRHIARTQNLAGIALDRLAKR